MQLESGKIISKRGFWAMLYYQTPLNSTRFLWNPATITRSAILKSSKKPCFRRIKRLPGYLVRTNLHTQTGGAWFRWGIGTEGIGVKVVETGTRRRCRGPVLPQKRTHRRHQRQQPEKGKEYDAVIGLVYINTKSGERGTVQRWEGGSKIVMRW